MCPVGIALSERAEMYNTWLHVVTVARQNTGAEYISMFNTNFNPSVDTIKISI